MRIAAVGLIGVLACTSAIVPVSYAQERSASLSIVARAEGGHEYFEVTGVGFPAESEIFVRAMNRRTRQGVTMYATSDPSGAFREAFVGRDADGRHFVVAPGKWVVRARSGEVTAKGTFSVRGSVLREGRYASDEALLTVEETKATFVFPCSRGRALEPIVPDENGDFDVAAVLIEERGPAEFPERPARMSGTVEGDRITFTVTAVANDRFPAAVYGPAEVIINRDPTFQRCV